MSSTSTDVLVPVLKGKVKYYNTAYKAQSEATQKMEAWFVRSIKASRNRTLLHIYAEENPIFKHLEDGSVVGVKSVIGPYTNKKGITTQAHFTIHENYLGSVEKLGKKPVGYKGWFNIQHHLEKFDIVFPDTAKSIADLFVLSSEDDEDDE